MKPAVNNTGSGSKTASLVTRLLHYRDNRNSGVDTTQLSAHGCKRGIITFGDCLKPLHSTKALLLNELYYTQQLI